MPAATRASSCSYRFVAPALQRYARHRRGYPLPKRPPSLCLARTLSKKTPFYAGRPSPPWLRSGRQGPLAPGETSAPRARVFRRRPSTTSFRLRAPTCGEPPVEIGSLTNRAIEASGTLCRMLAPGSRSLDPPNEGYGRPLFDNLTISVIVGAPWILPNSAGIERSSRSLVP